MTARVVRSKVTIRQPSLLTFKALMIDQIRFAYIIALFGGCRDYLINGTRNPGGISIRSLTSHYARSVSLEHSLDILTHVQDSINIIHPIMTMPNTKVSMPTEVRLLAIGTL